MEVRPVLGFLAEEDGYEQRLRKEVKRYHSEGCYECTSEHCLSESHWISHAL